MSIPKTLEFPNFKPSMPVMIKTLNNGYTVQIGCKSFVVSDLNDLMKELYAYLKGENSDFNKGFKTELGAIPEEAPGPPSAAEGPMQVG